MPLLSETLGGIRKKDMQREGSTSQGDVVGEDCKGKVTSREELFNYSIEIAMP